MGSAVLFANIFVATWWFLQLEESARFVGTRVPRVIVYVQQPQNTCLYMMHYLESHT